MPKATIQGVELYYETSGTGDPLVLLMGQSSGPGGRAPLLDALGRNNTVIWHDQRGTGRSQRVPEGASMDVLAADVLGVMDAAGIRKAHFLCHSTGCGMGHLIAAKHPGRVDRLVLAAPWSHADEHLVGIQELRKAAAAALAPDHYANFNAVLLFPPEYRRAHAAAFAEAAERAKKSPQNAAAIAARLDAILALDVRGLWPAIKCPTLVMVSPDDQIMPRWFGIEAANAIAGARLFEFDGGGHMLPETRTEVFVENVRAFLNERR